MCSGNGSAGEEFCGPLQRWGRGRTCWCSVLLVPPPLPSSPSATPFFRRFRQAKLFGISTRLLSLAWERPRPQPTPIFIRRGSRLDFSQKLSLTFPLDKASSSCSLTKS